MPLSAGTRLGVHEVLDLIGSGGMGEVYRARDARLGRDVVLLRLGIFASAVMFTVNFLLLRMPLTLDGRASYAPYAWFAIAAVLALAAAGFRLATTPGSGLIGNSRLRG